MNQGPCNGAYSLFARSNPDNSTSYALTISGGSIGLFKVVSHTWTVLSWLPYSCSDGTVMRLVVRGGALTMWSGPNTATYQDPTPLSGGQPGLGISSNDSMGNIQVGPIDLTPPAAISPASVTYSVTPREIALRWPASSDGPNGVGLSNYIIYRGGVYLGSSATPNWLDQTITAGGPTSYTIYACDQHGNLSPPAVVNVAATTTAGAIQPAAEARLRLEHPNDAYFGPQIDQRRVGVQTNGTYWGGAGEEIDMLSGNLNFSVPLMKAMGRGNWGVTFALSYNSQMWRQDSGGIWLLGEDVGVGLGWTLQAGSILPVWYGSSFLYYLYTDATGAQYVLDQNNSNVWSSIEGIHVYFDANAVVLHFTDGSFWNMNVQSGSTEQDAGTLYPSQMEDSNGNQLS